MINLDALIKYFPLFGQFIIIVGLVWTIAVSIKEIQRMEYTFYTVFINRIRYINYIGIINWIKNQPAVTKTIRSINDTEIAKSLNISIHVSKAGMPYHKYNNPYMWLKNNTLYLNFGFYVLATVGLVYEMIVQVSNGDVYKKPYDFFILSPIRSISIAYIIYFLVRDSAQWRTKFYNMLNRNQRLLTENEELKRKIHI
jgi:hypothetical protein